MLLLKKIHSSYYFNQVITFFSSSFYDNHKIVKGIILVSNSSTPHDTLALKSTCFKKELHFSLLAQIKYVALSTNTTQGLELSGRNYLHLRIER